MRKKVTLRLSAQFTHPSYARPKGWHMATIVTLTMNPALDKSTAVDRVVAERKLRCREPHTEPGGGGVNVSRALHRLGGNSAAIYPAGGPAGERLQLLLKEEGITYFTVPVKGETRENLIVFEETSTQQYRFGMPGPVLSDDEWQRCIARISSFSPVPDYIVASGSLPRGMPPDFYAEVARTAKILGSKMVLDAPADDLRPAVEEGVFMIKPNLHELEEITGRKIGSASEQEDAAREILRKGTCSIIVLSLGAEGALLVTGETSERIRSPAVPVRSKVGAGDSMVAGIVLSLAMGRSLHDAVVYGVAAGAAAVMTSGTELCRRQDTERLFEGMLEREHALT